MEESISDQLRAEIRQIVREELDRAGRHLLESTYPPEFAKGLEEVFRALQRDSSRETKERLVKEFTQALNELPYSVAKEILDATHEAILDSLKVSLSEGAQ